MLLITFIIIVVALVVPIMIGARIVGATNTGFGHALLAVICLAVVGVILEGFVGNEIVGFVVSAAVGGAILAGLLGTTFWRGLGISVIAAAIQIGVVLLLAAIVGIGAA